MKTTLHTPHDHVEDQTPAELRESAYRRGFQQGIYAALDATDHWDDPALNHWLSEIELWRGRHERYHCPRDQVQPPPAFNPDAT